MFIPITFIIIIMSSLLAFVKSFSFGPKSNMRASVYLQQQRTNNNIPSALASASASASPVLSRLQSRRLFSSTPLSLSSPVSSHASSSTCRSTGTPSPTTTSQELKCHSSKKEKSRFISFITDVEGDAGYFDRFVRNSRILDFECVAPTIPVAIESNSNSNSTDEFSLDYFPYRKRVIFQTHDSQQEGNEDDHDDDEDKDTDHVINSDMDWENSILVCGGDMVDKGGNDLYVLRQLISLQKRYKGRVHFVLGNRDINKMRILQELGIQMNKRGDDDDWEQKPSIPFHPGVYWFRGSGLQGDPDLIAQHDHKIKMKKGNDIHADNDSGIDERYDTNADDGASASAGADNDDDTSFLVPDSPAERLRWILKKTMGSPDAFEFRRNELRQEKMFLQSLEIEDEDKKDNHSDVNVDVDVDADVNNSSEDKERRTTSPIIITDDDVVESYRRMCHPRGIMGEYFQDSKLCLQIGGAMFMHGSLPITPEVLSSFNMNFPRDCTDTCIDRINNDTGEVEPFWKWFHSQSTPFQDPDRSGAREKENKDTGVTMDGHTSSSSTEWTHVLNEFVKRQMEAWKYNVTCAEEGTLGNERLWASVGGYQDQGSKDGDEDEDEDKAQDLSIEFGSLCQYGMGWLPDKTCNPTVVYNSWLSNGQPTYYNNKEEDNGAHSRAYQRLVKKFFDMSEINVIVTGHQPIGDVPFPIKVGSDSPIHRGGEQDQTKNDKRFVICADTSFSGDTMWNNNNNGSGRKNLGRGNSVSGRGDVAVSEVLLEQCISDGSIFGVSTHGILSDGSSYESINFLEDEEDMIGQPVDEERLSFVDGGNMDNIQISEQGNEMQAQSQSEWFVKMKMMHDSSYLVARSEGYEVYNSIMRRKVK